MRTLYGFFRAANFNRAVLVSSDGDRALLAISNAPVSIGVPPVYGVRARTPTDARTQ
jgi:hypothetical protein